MLQLLAVLAILPIGATLSFFVFWRWFHFWRRHRALTLTMMLGTVAALAAGSYLGRSVVFVERVDWPGWVVGVGWGVIAVVTGFGVVADRQLGLRVRAFTPYFEDNPRIELKTTGAYGVVRHPIYAAGIGFQLGVFLVTGYLAIVPALLGFALGAVWFTRQEEHRLMGLLDDPLQYVRYRERVPALLPWPRP